MDIKITVIVYLIFSILLFVAMILYFLLDEKKYPEFHNVIHRICVAVTLLLSIFLMAITITILISWW
jgi:hypothetical protein